jgi:hypothetical protein
VTIADEILGSGNSLPGQSFRLTQRPVLPNPEIFVLEPELPSAAERNEMKREQGSDPVQERPNAVTKQVEIWIRWREVPDFNGSYPHSRHYTLDHGTGEVAFGNGILGLVPPLGTDNIGATYRVGGGSAGNVAKGVVVQLRSPVPDRKHCGIADGPLAGAISNGSHTKQREQDSRALSACLISTEFSAESRAG